MSGRPTALKRARQIREVLLDYGVPEVSLELHEGRPSGSDRWNALNPVGVMSHHIVSRPTPNNPTPGLALVKRGTGSLPGPLCNGTAGVDLVYRIVTLGWANHPGYGGPEVLQGPLGAFTVPRDNARPYVWGTEYEGELGKEVWDQTYTNRRTGKAMTFREFMGRANAALAEAIWLPGINTHGNYDDIEPGMDLSGYHMEHKTWAPTRKIDRLGYTTKKGRDEIRRALELTRQEDDMHYSQWPKKAQEAMARDVASEVVRQWKREGVTIRDGKGEKKRINFKQALNRAANGPVVIRNQSKNVREDIDEVLDQLDADNSEGDSGEA